MVTTVAAMLLTHLAQLEPFSAAGYTAQVAGVWYAGGSAASAMPLGGLGTGFIDLTSTGAFGASTMENNWLKPRPLPSKCGFIIKIGNQAFELLPGSTSLPANTRFWGHYPAADIDFSTPANDVAVWCRAFAPLIPHDYDSSGIPAALFRYAFINHNGTSPMPVELSFQWQAPATAGIEAVGNVEGALRWKCGMLAPGKTWTVTPIILFGKDRAALAQRAREPRIAAAPLVMKDTANGKAADFGDVKDFMLDAFGGFNWEDHKVQSATYGDAPTLGQIFWRLSYGSVYAGRGFKGPYGLKGKGLPATTDDGALQVKLSASEAGPDAVALAFTIKNVSKKDIKDLRFGFSANVDIGGPKGSADQRVSLDKQVGGLVFDGGAGKKDGPLVALAGDAQDCIPGVWPEAHQAMESDAGWMPLDSAPVAPAFDSYPDGIQIRLASGSYAIGAVAPGWHLENTALEDNVVRTTAKRTLAPGEAAELTFGLGWYFPEWLSSDGETLRHRYADKFANAAAAVGTALKGAKELEAKVTGWQQTVYESPSPALLRDAVINSLYILPRNSWWMADGRFFQSESFTGCPITETFVCRYYASVALALLFPELERTTMRSIAGAQAKTGEIPFAFGSPAASRSPYYHVQHPIVSSEFALVTWRNCVLWQDRAYLEEMYPKAIAALRFAMTLDKDRDGLVDEDPGNETGFPANQYYDIWPWWGTSAYTGGIWLAALRAGEEMAKAKGDTAVANEMRVWYTRALDSYQQKLWTGNYYRLYNDPAHQRSSDTCLTNALCGQWFAYTCGLGEIVSKSAIDSTISSVLQLNVAATHFGAVNGVRPDHSPDVSFKDHSAVLTIGEVWCFAAMAAFHGRVEDGLRVFVDSYANILLNQRTPWNIPWSLDPQTGAIKWGINYYSNPCVWTVLQAVDPATFAKLSKPPQAQPATPPATPGEP